MNEKVPVFFYRAVLGIRIHMFLGLQDPDPDQLVSGADPDLKSLLNEFFFASSLSFKDELLLFPFPTWKHIVEKMLDK
jgi:hypothetical protein